MAAGAGQAPPASRGCGRSPWLCLVGPFLVVAGLHLQSATPGDTPFGQWVHASGFAIPMVILGFGGQWLLPVLTAIVAGDIFSAEDHFGTWKTILTRSRSRGELFAGKFLAALTFAVAAMVLLTVSDLAAGLLAGTQPVVGLAGQLVPAGHATELVLASWVSELPPVLGFTALAVLAVGRQPQQRGRDRRPGADRAGAAGRDADQPARLGPAGAAQHAVPGLARLLGAAGVLRAVPARAW